MLDITDPNSKSIFLTSRYLDNFIYHFRTYKKSENLEFNKKTTNLLVTEFLKFSKKAHPKKNQEIENILNDIRNEVFKISTPKDFDKLYDYLHKLEFPTDVWII